MMLIVFVVRSLITGALQAVYMYTPEVVVVRNITLNDFKGILAGLSNRDPVSRSGILQRRRSMRSPH